MHITAPRLKKISVLLLAFCTALLLLVPLQVSAKSNKPPVRPGKLKLSSVWYNVGENKGSVTITVERTDGKDGQVGVSYCNCSFTAKAGSDFGHVNGTLVFNDGETRKTFTVPIYDDNQFEFLEAFVVQLKNPTGGATLGSSKALVHIEDNDLKK